MNKRTKRGVAIVTLAIFLFGVGKLLGTVLFSKEEVTNYDEGDKEGITAELFYFSACESCREGQKFEDTFRKQLRESGVIENITCISYNAFLESDRRHIEKRMEELGLELDYTNLPSMLIKGKLYQGNYQELGLRAGAVVNNDRIEANGEGAVTHNLSFSANDTIFLLFTTYACESCNSIKKFLDDNLPEQVIIGKGENQIISPVHMVEYNIMDENNLEFLYSLIETYQVPDMHQP